ncbi:uncharacterized protein DNG_05812 [Cephalotrichum gorgonifer]|uniref:Zn(2)-C6 fungal-type domain-containing protein n=1 Tax=Cephalotrichum gorgonifer TaxID=2041049 RepID=A0AAE8N1G0_9PEZI|nr:uncharacterized protein DNG_05812 [Cephalotrichum gorgonifer]
MDSASRRGDSEDAEPYDTAAVAELLRTKRKPRTAKSCFPCRHRKVRCDGLMPCSNCVSRDHVSLCRMAGVSAVRKSSPQPRAAPPRDSRRVESPGLLVEGSVEMSRYSLFPWFMLQKRMLNGSVSSPASETTKDPTRDNTAVDANHVLGELEKIEKHIASLKSDLLLTGRTPTSNPHLSPTGASHSQHSSLAKTTAEWAARVQDTAIPAILSGGHALEGATGATIFLGSRSDPPLVLGCRPVPAHGHPDPDNSGPDQLVPKAYPFASLWSQETSLSDIARVLPDDSDILRYWGVYQSCVHPFYPALVTFEDFGSQLLSFLDLRLSGKGEAAIPPETKPSWLALLLSIIACGAQFSTDPIKERDLRSKVFVCSSFQCLRMSNFFATTDMDHIQAMALLGHCLRNNLDMNSAWIIMGSTIRLAQSIGLHIDPRTRCASSPGAERTSIESYRGYRLWWMLLWQDCFLTTTYDRPFSNPYILGRIPDDTSPGAGNSFATSVLLLIKTYMGRSMDEITSPAEANSIEGLLAHKCRLESVLDRAQPFLVDERRCTTLQEQLQRAALRIHVGYLVCRVYRLCLGCEDAAADQVLRDTLATDYLANATRVVQSFLDMHHLLPAGCQTWAIVQNVASSAIPLKSLSSISSLLLEKLVSEFEPLVRRLISVLEAKGKECEWYDADTNVRQYGPCSRVARALRETYGDI